MTKEKHVFNYIYFGAFLLFLFAISLLQLFSISDGTFSFHLLFLIDAIGQSLLEVLLITFLASLISTTFPRSFFSCYIALTVLIVFFQLIDLILVRLLDFTIWFALDFVLEDQLSNFLELLSASNISLLAWGGVFIAIAAFIALGLTIYRRTEGFSQKRALIFSLPMQALSISVVLLALIIWDFSTRHYFSFASSEKYEKALPFKFTFFSRPCPKLFLSSPLKPQPQQSFPTPLPQPKTKPDIYLFIVESLRDDFITPEVSPNLYAFKQDNVSFDLALSSANGTHLSWYSLLYSQLPFHWKTAQNAAHKKGPPPLRLFKELGYEIHTYTASHLHYYEMDEVLFGTKHHLATSFFFSPHGNQQLPHQSDSTVISRLQSDHLSKQDSPPRLCIIFLDSTHFDYSWPQTEKPHFEPIAQGVGYWKATFGKGDIEGVKNRYKNAMLHVDTLFGKFLKSLYSSKRGSESLVVFTGDHAEEFCEKGFLFHGSHLSHEQTHIPLYYSFGKENTPPFPKQTELTSHLDVFPSLYHAIYHKEAPPSLFQGESIFKEDRWPYVLTARYNAGRTPYEFFIHNGTTKLLVQFAKKKNISECQEIKILGLTTKNDTPLDTSTQEIKELYDNALLTLFPPQ